MRPPNVLFVTVDQWRGDCLGLDGHPALRTPHLDALARDGVRFRRHYAQAAPCGPSRASLYTGTYLMNHRSVLNGTPLDARFTNVALEARRAGYEPALFGYTDQSVDPRTVPPDDPRLFTYEGVLPGFDPVLHLPEHLGPWVAWLAERGHEIPDNPRDIYRPRSDEPGAPTRYAADETEAAFLVDSLTSWLGRRGDDPWFVHAAFIRPHPPFVAPEPYNRLVDPAAVPDPVRGASPDVEAAQHPFVAAALAVGALRAPGDDAALRLLRATYYGMQAEVDAQLGRLFAWLVDHGQWGDTIVVLTSDHGEMLGDHWTLEKWGYFDGSYHIPLVIRHPAAEFDATRGSAVDAFTENVDVMPTILRLLDLEPPAQCDGRSLVSFLRGEEPPGWRTAVHWEWDFRDPVTHLVEDHFGIRSDECTLAVLRDERGKYVHFTALPPVYFDLTRDPHELVNRAGDAAHAPTVLDYAQRLLSWRMANADRTLANHFVGPGGLTVRNDRLP